MVTTAYKLHIPSFQIYCFIALIKLHTNYYFIHVAFDTTYFLDCTLTTN